MKMRGVRFRFNCLELEVPDVQRASCSLSETCCDDTFYMENGRYRVYKFSRVRLSRRRLRGVRSVNKFFKSNLLEIVKAQNMHLCISPDSESSVQTDGSGFFSCDDDSSGKQVTWPKFGF